MGVPLFTYFGFFELGLQKKRNHSLTSKKQFLNEFSFKMGSSLHPGFSLVFVERELQF